MQDKVRFIRFPLVLVALASLLLAGWLGLARIGWRLPPIAPLMLHGPLMMAGFFGTLISVERAVALQKPWAYAGAALCALGAIMLLLGQSQVGAALITLSSLIFTVISAVMANRHRALYSLILALAGLLWLAGNSLWLSGLPVYRVVHWWVAFLVITIAGERLELARMIRISKRATAILACILVGVVVGLVIAILDAQIGIRIVGAGYVALAGWLFFYDVAQRTVRSRGLPRYVAICLLGGYVWLAVGGVIALAAGAVAAGLLYDALLHSLLIGFIMSMIFGHAPIILPALLKRMVIYFPAMYAPLVLLHVSIILRVSADLLIAPVGRQWGGLLNAAAILFFLGMMVYAQRGSQSIAAQSDPINLPDNKETTDAFAAS